MADVLDFVRHKLSSRGRIRVGFLGIGKTNLALIRRLSTLSGIDFVYRDRARDIPEGLPIGERFVRGSALLGIREDILFVAPSVRRDHPYLTAAAMRGTLLLSDCEVFFDGCDKDIYAVSGSDGKSSTVYLASRLLSTDKRQLFPLGNFGTPLCTYHGEGPCAVELSSFNLQYLTPKSKRAVITNITENHLDWHRDFAEYTEAKARLLQGSEAPVINADCEVSATLIGRVRPFALFTARASSHELMGRGAEACLSLREDKIYLGDRLLLDTRVMKRSLYYDRLNMMAAIALTLGEADEDRIYSVAKEFGGLADRAETVGAYRGVTFINSSIDTTPARTVATLTSLGKRVHLLLGGRSKRLSLEGLCHTIAKYAESVTLFGEAREEFAAALGREGLHYTVCESFSDAVYSVLGGAVTGDTVLLSPAATSYDEFGDYSARGARFKQIIKDYYNEE